MQNQSTTKPPADSDQTTDRVGVGRCDLLAFSSILGGLLASGHYTEPLEADEDESIDGTGLICDDYGKDWREYQADDPKITGRYIPVALQTAEILLNMAKRNLEANVKHIHR